MPFYYASLSGLWVFYQVDAERLEPYLEGMDIEVARFEGRGLAAVNLLRYSAHLAPLLHAVTQVEFTIIVFPVSRSAHVPDLSARQFLLGEDMTKTLGHLRLHVPCDSASAVEAGNVLFGEPKFTTTFTCKVPTSNDPDVTAWDVTCHDPEDASRAIFSLHVNIADLPADTANPSPLITYNQLNGRLAGCRKNLLGTFPTWFPDPAARGMIRLSPGGSDHPMRGDLEAVLSDAQPFAVQTFEPAPVAIEGRAFYVDP
jgi:hypothetical protein